MQMFRLLRSVESANWLMDTPQAVVECTSRSTRKQTDLTSPGVRRTTARSTRSIRRSGDREIYVERSLFHCAIYSGFAQIPPSSWLSEPPPGDSFATPRE